MSKLKDLEDDPNEIRFSVSSILIAAGLLVAVLGLFVRQIDPIFGAALLVCGTLVFCFGVLVRFLEIRLPESDRKEEKT